MVRAVVVDIVGHLFAFLVLTADAAANRCLAGIVFAKLFRVWQNSLEELDRHDFHAIVIDRLDACHSDVLNHAQMCQIFLAERHPETCALD